jgi:hypothetical protein
MLGTRGGLMFFGSPRCSWACVSSIVLLLLGLLFIYSRLIFEGLVLAGFDTQTYFYPYWTYAFESLRAGRIPLWNPNLFTGAPFLANPQAAVFYLPNWLLWPISPERALGFALVLHVALAAVGTLVFSRVSFKTGWPGASTAGAAFAFGGYFAAQAGHINQVSTVAWLPWLLLALDRAVCGDRRGLWAAPIITALMLLAGHPQALYMSLVFSLAFVVLAGASTVAAPNSRRVVTGIGRALSVWLVCICFGTVLAAVQVLPTLQLSRHGIRSGGLSLYEAASFSLPREEFLSAVLPTFVELPSSTEFVAHVGISGFVLALLGVFAGVARGRTIFLASTVALTIALSLGPATPLFTVAHKLVPGFDLFRVPPRWLVLGTLAAALLAGQGVDSLGANVPRSVKGRRMAGMAIVLCVVILIMTWLAVLHPVPNSTAISWGVAGAVTIAVLALAYSRKYVWLQWSGTILLVVELVVASGPGLVREPIPDSAYRGESVVHEFLASDSWNGRVLSVARPEFEVSQLKRARLAGLWREELGDRSWREFLVALKNEEIMHPNLPMVRGVASVDGYDGGVLPLRSYVVFRDLLLPGTGDAPDRLLQHQIETIPPDRVLNALAVQHVVRNQDAVLNSDGVQIDLSFSRWIDGTQTWDDLQIEDVIGITVVIDALFKAEAGEVGRIEIQTGRGELKTFPLSRLPKRPERIVVGPGHLASTRAGLVRPSYVSSADLGVARDVTKVIVVATTEGFDLRALAFRHADGGATSLLLRSGEPAVSRSMGDVSIVSRAASQPRARLVNDVRVVPSIADAGEVVRARRFDPTSFAVLVEGVSKQPPLGSLGWFFQDVGIFPPDEFAGFVDPDDLGMLRPLIGGGALMGSGSGSRTVPDYVVSVLDEPERLQLHVQAGGTRLLVLPDAPYPGWRAYVNGVQQTVWRANVGNRAILIPEAGTHTVEFKFRSFPFEVGSVLSVFGLVVFFAFVITTLLLRRRQV